MSKESGQSPTNTTSLSYQNFWALKVKACDLSQWSPDLEKDVATATKSPVEVEYWGSCPLINLDSISWLHLLEKDGADQAFCFLSEMPYKGHRLFIDNELPCSALAYDAKRREIIVWRSHQDAPIYWSIQKHTLIVSRGLCGPVRAGWMAFSPNRETIASYLYLGQVPENSSLAEEIYKLAPGQGLVFKLQSGALFDFQHHPESKTKEKPALLFSSALESLWQLQEPRADLFLANEEFFPLFTDLEKALTQTSPARPISTHLGFFLTHIMVRLKSTTKWQEKLRVWLSRRIYKSLEPLIQWFQNRCVFSYQDITDKMLAGCNQTFCPWNFLQSLTHQRLYEPMTEWPDDISTHFYRLLPQDIFLKNASTHPNISNQEWIEIVKQLHKSSLIEEGIVSSSLLYKLEYALKSSNKKARLQASCLLSLELWLKLFIDLHAKPPSNLKDWKQLMN